MMFPEYSKLCIGLFIVCLFQVVVAEPVKIDTNSRVFVDTHGRQLLFHGVNAVYKVPPFIPSSGAFDPKLSLNNEDIENLAKWGFNVVRLGVMWPATEPERGQYNTTYLYAMRDLIQKLYAAGIYTIVDVHQDLYSPFFCGEGAPDWAVALPDKYLPFPIPVHLKEFDKDPKTGYPLVSECLKTMFGLFYFADATGAAFEGLYENRNGTRDAFGSMWQEMAKIFSQEDGVLGYELINEPAAGDVIRHPELLEPGVAEKKYLAGMYKEIAEKIRTVDDNHIVFFEPMTFNIGEVGFTEGPGGSSYNDRQALSVHVYCGPVDKKGDPRIMWFCNATESWWFDVRENDVERLGTGWLLTEFGAMYDDPVSLESIDYVTTTANKYHLGWIYWQFKTFGDYTTQGGSAESFYDSDGSLQTTKVKALSQTYAPIVAGLISSIEFDPLTANFELQYSVQNITSRDTFIYLNEEMWYKDGYTTTVHPPTGVIITHDKPNYLKVSHSEDLKYGDSVKITVAAK